MPKTLHLNIHWPQDPQDTLDHWLAALDRADLRRRLHARQARQLHAPGSHPPHPSHQSPPSPGPLPPQLSTLN